MMKPLKTALIGFGQIAARYSEDPYYKKHVKYATHAEVLSAHKAFKWTAVVDTSQKARKLARERWNVGLTVSSAKELACAGEIDVAVIATPPEARLSIIDSLPNLKAVIVEKPLAKTVKEAGRFLAVCKKRNILVQVNITRRADLVIQKLSRGALTKEIGDVQAAFGIYGNGLINNGTHMVDLVRSLLGEVRLVQALPGAMHFQEGPIKSDKNISFILYLDNGITAMFHPVRFASYREMSLDMWGKKGRLAIVQEGLKIISYPRTRCRSLSGSYEVASDKGAVKGTGYGDALYGIYDNLAKAISRGASLVSPGESALRTAEVIESILRSYDRKGRILNV